MKKNLIRTMAIALGLAIAAPASAQFNLGKAISAGKKAVHKYIVCDT